MSDAAIKKSIENIHAKARQERQKAAAEEFVSPCLKGLTGDCATIAGKVDNLCCFLHKNGLPISEQSIPFVTGVTYKSKLQKDFNLTSINFCNFLNYVSAPKLRIART